MGGKESKVTDSKANGINTVEVLDYEDDFLGIQHTLDFIAVLLGFLAIFKFVSIDKRSVQRSRAPHHTRERLVYSIPQS